MTLPPPRFNGAEGKRRKLEALALLEAHRELFVLRGRRALLSHMLEGDGTADADDVRRVVEIPAGISPNLFGSVPGSLARANIIRLARLRLSARPARHAGINRVWQLVDRATAIQWLAAHPDRPAPATPGESFDLFHLINTIKNPAVQTPGEERKGH